MTVEKILFSLLLAGVFFSCKKKSLLPSPAGLNITNISDTSCSINWDAVSGANSYKISVALDESFTNVISGFNETEITNTNVDITTLTPYTKYFVKVVAQNTDASSDPATANFMTLDADGLVILPWDNNSLYAFDARNGNVKWIFSGSQMYATPIIQDSIVYIGGVDTRLYAINISDGSLKWKSTATMGAFFSANALIRDGVIYIGDYGGTCYAYNANNGSMKWHYDIPSPYRNINSTPVLDGNTVYFASYDGKIYALDASTGAYKWSTNSTGNPIMSGMSLINGNIYVGALPKVYAFDATTGATKWITQNPSSTSYSSSPTIADNNVFIGGEDGKMYAFSTTDGSVVWSKIVGTGSIVSSPIYKNGIVYIGAGDGKMYALQSNTGNLVWQNSSTGSSANIYSGPTLSGKTLYSGTLEGKVVSIDIQTGVTKWISIVAGARFQASPSVITYKGDVYYPGLSGDIQ